MLYPANAKINTAAANRVVEAHKSAGLLASSIDPAGLLNLSRPIVEMTATGSAAEQAGQLGGETPRQICHAEAYEQANQVGEREDDGVENWPALGLTAGS